MRSVPALLLGLALAHLHGCDRDETPPPNECAVFFTCYAECRARTNVYDEDCNEPISGSRAEQEHERCFDECDVHQFDFGQHVTLDSGLYPLNNKGGSWRWISECLSGEL